jgi:hypothetical protein
VEGACPILDHLLEHSTKHIFNDLIDSLSLSVRLGVICRASDEMGAQTLM